MSESLYALYAMKKQTAALTATRRLDVEKAIDMAKHDKTTPWTKQIKSRQIWRRVSCWRTRAAVRDSARRADQEKGGKT